MFFKARPILTALALLIAQRGEATESIRPILSAAELALHRGQQPLREAQALAFLRSRAMGLAAGDDFVQINATTNAQGQAVVRFAQTHQGHPVFGTSITVRVDLDGTCRLLATDVAQGISVAGDATLSTDEAVLAVHRNLAPEGEYEATPTVEQVLFPTIFTQGFQLTMDDEGHPRIDRAASLVGPQPSARYVWAYRVEARLANPQDGFHEYAFLVDAQTGQILRKWDTAAGVVPQRPKAPKPLDYGQMARIAASRPRVALAATQPSRALAPAVPGNGAATVPAVPTKGWGYDQYLGQVPLDTSQSPLGTGYDLVDVTRSTRPHPRFQTSGNQTWYWDPMPYWGVAPSLTDYQFPYYRYAFYNTYTMENTSWSVDPLAGAGSTTNVFGDGQNYVSPYGLSSGYVTHVPKSLPELHLGDANGQTAAVGAHFAMQVTYDMYKNVFGRLGIDAKDTAMIQVVHDNQGSFSNAHWSSGDMMMHYGDGDWSPLNDGGFTSFTQITIAGHEMSHGEMDFSAGVHYWAEGMGLNEANSDIMGVCVEAYSKRGPLDPPDQIPEGKVSWAVAPEISVVHRPIRRMDKPSLDGISTDAWFAGIDNLDGHYTSGVANRFFYFLSMGSSADASNVGFSAFMPQGMAGIGIDAAARIWYKAVTEYMTPSTTLRGMRAPLLSAATDLYGADAAQVQAVANALAAVNIGAPYGSTGRPLVTFPTNLVSSDSPLGVIGLPNSSYNGQTQYLYYSTPMVPMGEATKLRAVVSNATDRSVKWTTGWPFLYVPFPNDRIAGSSTPAGPAAANGSFDSEGVYHAPLMGPKFCMVQATSVEDPTEFGYLPTLVVHLDSDGDGDSDAVDMGAFALCYGLPYDVADYVNFGGYPLGTMYYGSYGYLGYTFDDYSMQAWNQAFMNAFAQ